MIRGHLNSPKFHHVDGRDPCAAFAAEREEANNALADAGDQLEALRGRLAEVEVQNGDLQRRLAVAEALENEARKRQLSTAEDLRAEQAELGRMREALGKLSDRCHEQAEQIAHFTRELHCERLLRVELETKLARGVQVLAGAPDEIVTDGALLPGEARAGRPPSGRDAVRRNRRKLPIVVTSDAAIPPGQQVAQ